MGLFGLDSPATDRTSQLQAAYAEQERLKQEQVLRDQEEARRQAQILALQTQTPKQSQQQGSGINPMSFMNSFQGNSGGGLGSIFGGGSTGVTAGNGAAHTGGAMGASGGGSASGGASGLSSLAGFWPAAVVAAVVGNELYQNNTGNRESEAFPLEWGLEGRAFYKDKDKWADKANSVIPGWGDDINIAGNLSSPVDLFRGKTWSSLADSLKRGGTLGGILRKVF